MILRASLCLGSFTAKTEATAHPGGERSPRDAGPCSLRAWTPAPCLAGVRHTARGVGPATSRSPPASRDREARAARHASRSPRRSIAAPLCAPPRSLTCTPRWAAGPGSGARAAAPASAPFLASPAARSASEAAPAASWRRQGPRTVDPQAATVTTARPDSSRLQQRRPLNGDNKAGGLLRCDGDKAPLRRPRCRPVSGSRARGPTLEGAPCSAPRERAAGGVRRARLPRNLAIDDSALNGATWEREECPAQAPGRPRVRVSRRFQHLGCARSFQNAPSWRTLALKGILQTTPPAAPPGPGVPGAYPVALSSCGVCSEKP